MENLYTPRQIEIIAYLINQETQISSEQAAEYLGLSRKTLRNEAEEIADRLGEEGKLLINKKGYKLEFISDRARGELCRQLEYYGGRSSLGVRPSVFALYLLFLKEYASMQYLAEVFYLSKTAVSLEVQTLKRWVERYDGLELEVSNTRGIRIIGEEKRKRAYCAKFGTLYAFRGMPVDQEISCTYEKYLQDVREILMTVLQEQNELITGEEYRKNSRFIAVSILRTMMGYKRQDIPEKRSRNILAEKIREMVKERTGYFLNEAEVDDIGEMLRESSTLINPEYDPIVGNANLEIRLDRMEQRLSEILGTGKAPLFPEKAVVLQHLSRMELRRKAGNVAINHYNEDIVRRYPLEVHLMYRLIPEMFGGRVTKETSFMALFLGTALNSLRDKISVLLVSNQNQSVITQIREAIYQCGTPHIRVFQVIPGYVFEENPAIIREYDAVLATDQETALAAPGIFQIPCVMSYTDTENLDLYLKHCGKRVREKKRSKIRDQYLREVEIDSADGESLEEMIGFPGDEYQSYHTIDGKKLFICRISPEEENEIVVYWLKKPILFQYKRIGKILFARYREGTSGILDFFDTVKELMITE